MADDWRDNIKGVPDVSSRSALLGSSLLAQGCKTFVPQLRLLLFYHYTYTVLICTTLSFTFSCRPFTDIL